MLRVIVASGLLQIKQSFSRPMYKYSVVIHPILFAILTYMIFRNSGQENIASFVFLGSGLASLWGCICFSSAGDIERERFMGTLEFIFNTPTDFKAIMLGKIIGNTVLGLAPFGISYVIINVFFGSKIVIGNVYAFAIAVLAALLSFVGISMLFSAWFTLSKSARILMNCIEYPVIILCGLLFPIEILPDWTRPISYILSPTWAAKLLRMGIDGVMDERIFMNNLYVILLLTIGYFVLAYVLYGAIDKRTRINATLGVR